VKTTHMLGFIVLAAVFATIVAVPSAANQPLSWRVEYDDQGRIARSVDPAGRVTQYGYVPVSDGPLQSFTATPSEGAPVTWIFAPDGQLSAMNDAEGEVMYSYDNRGRLKAIERKGTPVIQYGYDDIGRIAELSVGDFYRIAWTYDFLGRIAALETPAGRIFYEYQTGQGIVIRSLPNGVKTFWKRQSNGELMEITHGYFEKPGDASYSVLAQYTYGHGPDGRIVAIREQSGQGEFACNYMYDAMGRLTRATGPGGREYGYEYDILGNRTRATATGRPDQICTYDWAGRLTSVDGKPCTYNACGNLAEVTIGGVSRQYSYHPDGLLAEARVGEETVQYRYDGFGRLVGRITAAGQTRFIPDPLSSYWQPLVIEESDGTRTLVVWDGPTPLALVRNGQVEWLLHDHLGSVRLITDGKGQVTQNLDYDPFGVPEKPQGLTALMPGFAGLLWDNGANGYLALARAFIPKLGGFLQPDPHKPIPSYSPEDVCLYLYCAGDPVGFVDRGGEKRYVIDYGDIPRDFVMDQIIAEAFKNPFPIEDIYDRNVDRNDLTTRAYFRVLDWRYNAKSFNDAFPDPSRRPTAAELRNVENQLLSQMTVFTGKNRARRIFGIDLTLLDGKPGKAVALVEVFKIAAWATCHWFFETFDKPNPLDKHGMTLARDPKTIPRQLMGVLTGLRWAEANAIARDYERVFVMGLGRSYANPREQSYPPPPQVSLEKPKPPYRNELKRRRDDYPPIFPPPPGGGGGGGGWGGPPPPGGGGGGSGLSPSRVGGVYLGGSGGAVDGLGTLKGVRTDDNGNLVLVGEDCGDIKLPPLRLDDIVTVFRSVYIYGEGPTVTIDPNPENPEKSAMIVRHGKGTEETYVGWVLYQADRLMKGYSQGMDNFTEKDIASRVPGYSDIVDKIYFGAGDPREIQKDSIWERFWIVPAAVNRFEGSRRELTLFDVPLKVNTQKMKWVKDSLVDDPTGSSSPGALAFTGWFTKNYDGIAAEQYLMPPAESGITDPVPVFSELRRIALVTAIAEKLRDQGVPMPFWMHDYEVRNVPIDRFTPGMEVTRKRQRDNMLETARIFGGVKLTPDTKAVKTYASVADAAEETPAVRTEVDRSITLAARLEKAIIDAVPPVASPPLTLHRVAVDTREYQAVTVPGTKTLALNPCRLAEVDVAVPVTGGRDIQLVRSFNSFFDPKGPWGRSWTLDLPYLVEIRVPVEHEAGKSSYTVGYELLTPLNSLNARFLNGYPVLGFGNPIAPAVDKNSPFRGTAKVQPAFLKDDTTRVLMFQDGREWHFTPYGDLVAIKDGPQVTVYERGAEGQVTRIVGLLGDQLVGEIKLEYDGNQKLTKAVGTSFDHQQSTPIEVTYTYGDAGRLSGVTSDEGTVGYSYDGSWVTTVTWQDKAGGNQPVVIVSFEYNAQGQLLSEKSGSATIVHSISPSLDGVVAVSYENEGDTQGSGTKTVSTRYDQRMRPTESTAADGTSTRWNYRSDGSVEMSITAPDQQFVTVVSSSDGRTQTIQREGAPPIMAQFDSGGRMTSLSEEGNSVLTQEWRSDGQLARAETFAQGASFNYDEQAMLSSVVLHPAKAEGTLSEWQETRLDRMGHPVEVTDCSGLHVFLEYNESDALTAFIQQTPEGNYGYKVERNEDDRIKAVSSSWGSNAYTYDSDGNLSGIVATSGDQSASVEFSGDLVRSITGFDSSHTSFDYFKDGPAAGMPKSIVCPDSLKLEYEYDSNGRPSAVKVGMDRRVRLEYDPEGRMVAYTWEPTKR